MNILAALINLYSGKKITHASWGSPGEVFYVQIEYGIPVMRVAGDAFRQSLAGGRNNLYVTINPFVIWKYTVFTSYFTIFK